jgi:hypothetical protein
MAARDLGFIPLVAVLGCGPDAIVPTCLIAQPIDPDVCRVLPTGLVLHEQGEQLHAGMLLDDGTIEPIGALPEALDCHAALAHDPESGKLWWEEEVEYDLPPILHQLDLASGTEDWQRELTQEGFSRVWLNSMVFHEGALVLAGAAGLYDPWPTLKDTALLQRLDANGATVWTQLGQPGFGLTGNETQPMEYATHLLGVDGAVAFAGVVSGEEPDPNWVAFTLASADLATGDLLATTLVWRGEGWFEFFDYAGRADLVLALVGLGGATDGTPSAHTDVAAISPLGEQLWRVDIQWSGFIIADFAQVVLNDRVVHIATATSSTYTEDDAHTRVIVRSHAGEVLCDGGLPELSELGQPGQQRVWDLRGEQMVLAAEFDDGHKAAWALRSKF